MSIELSARTSVVLCVGLYGKTVALQSLALSLCTRYPPTRVQLAVADYQNGIGRGGLPPHIAAHRAQHRPANPPGHWESWCAYLNTELDRRAGQLGEYPELVVMIDALSELLGEHPALAAIVQRVVDEGPGRGVRLIASSTQPAAVFAAADRQQVTLRGDAVIALRTATSQDSMDLLGKPDAWYLPETPGHAYLGSAAGTIEGPIRLFDGSGIAGDLVERLVTA